MMARSPLLKLSSVMADKLGLFFLGGFTVLKADSFPPKTLAVFLGKFVATVPVVMFVWVGLSSW